MQIGEEYRLPDFIIAGMMKCGTTSLHYYLSQHPEIYMPQGKAQETHFFDYDENFFKGAQHYSKMLGNSENRRVIGQTCPNYMHLPKVPARIKELLPNVKLVFILRNPVDRAYSHYWHEVKKNRENESFEESLRLESQRIRHGGKQLQNFSYLHRGEYATHLKTYLDLFQKEAIRVVIYEHLRLNPLAEVNKCFDHIGLNHLDTLDTEAQNVTIVPRSQMIKKLVRSPKVNAFPFISIVRDYELKVNRTIGYKPISHETRDRLIRHFHDHNRELEQLMGIDVTVWNK